MIPSRRAQGGPSGPPIPRALVAIALALPPLGIVGDVIAKAAKEQPVATRAAVHIPERAIVDPQHERNLPFVGETAAEAYEDRQERTRRE